MKFNKDLPLLWLGVRAGVGLACLVVIFGMLFSSQWWEVCWSMILDWVALLLGGLFTWGWLREQKSSVGFFKLIEFYGKYFFTAMMSWWLILLVLLVSLLVIIRPDPVMQPVSQDGLMNNIAQEFVRTSTAFSYSMVLNFWILIRFMLLNLILPLLYMVFAGGKSGGERKRVSGKS